MAILSKRCFHALLQIRIKLAVPPLLHGSPALVLPCLLAESFAYILFEFGDRVLEMCVIEREVDGNRANQATVVVQVVLSVGRRQTIDDGSFFGFAIAVIPSGDALH